MLRKRESSETAYNWRNLWNPWLQVRLCLCCDSFTCFLWS